jgi:hypothetical protein
MAKIYQIQMGIYSDKLRAFAQYMAQHPDIFPCAWITLVNSDGQPVIMGRFGSNRAPPAIAPSNKQRRRAHG